MAAHVIVLIMCLSRNILVWTLLILLLVKEMSFLFNESSSAKKVIRYDGCQVWRIQLKDTTSFKVISNMRKELEVKLWRGNKTHLDIFVYSGRKGQVAERLMENLIDYKVTMHDVQKTINGDEFNIFSLMNISLAVREESPISFETFPNLTDIYGYLDYLSKRYPFCRVFEIGKSFEGVPLKVLHISRGIAMVSAWIESGMHGIDWIAPSTVLYIIDYLVTNDIFTKNHDVMDIDFYFLVVANPDGYRYSHDFDRLWQKNRRPLDKCFGVNLNRNFGYHFGGSNGVRDPCDDHYGGEKPFSEPETVAIRDFFRTAKINFSVHLAFHSYGQYILYPWGYELSAPMDYKELQLVADHAAVAIYNRTGEEYVTGSAGTVHYPHPGNSQDWAKGELNVKYTYCIELRDQGSYGYLVPATYIVPSGRDGLGAFKAIMKDVILSDIFLSKSTIRSAPMFHVWRIVLASAHCLVYEMTNLNYIF